MIDNNVDKCIIEFVYFFLLWYISILFWYECFNIKWNCSIYIWMLSLNELFNFSIMSCDIKVVM